MPLSTPIPRRALRHTRAIDVQAYQRDDGLWDIDAHITDRKTADTVMATGVLPAGLPLHDLYLRLTIDSAMSIVDAESASDAYPYPGACNTVGSAYKSLIGLNLCKGFWLGVKQRLGDNIACTHLTELAQVLPTAAIQAMGGDLLRTGDGEDTLQSARAPFQIDKCHALRADGHVVAQFYPRWTAKATPA